MTNGNDTEQTDEDELNLTNLFDDSDCKLGDTSHLPVNKYKPTNETTVKRVYHLGRIISKILCKHNIPYWVTGGTLLGCVRHKGLIPWDDDLDICLLNKHEDEFYSLCNVFLENDIILKESFSGYCLYHRTESVPSHNPVDNDLLDYRFPFCDVLIMRENFESDRFEIRNGRSRTLWTNEWYLKSEVEPLKEMLFGDFYFMTVNDPTPYLHRTYGKDCMQVGKTHNYNHITRSSMQSETIDTSKGFQPAKPFN